jgi:5,10-methylenetetrahydromethanopterin reductase
VEISCGFPPSFNAAAYAELAEELGYKRAWVYDSPAVYPDVWVALSRCAERTSRIELGPGVLIPSLRHPMVNAAAIADLVSQVPGRVMVALGSGFSGRLAMGKRPMPWAKVAEYVRCLRTLLAGETGVWEGAKVRMLHTPGFGAARPIQVPILIAADGPKGLAVAAELGDGVFSIYAPESGDTGAADWDALLCFGTVLEEGEQLTSPRVVDALGPGAVVLYHLTYVHGGAAAVDALPGGRRWRDEIELYPEDERHLAMHAGHLVKVNPLDEPYLPEIIPLSSTRQMTGTADQIAEKIAGFAARGVTEVSYQPSGSDIERELRAFATAAGLRN